MIGGRDRGWSWPLPLLWSWMWEVTGIQTKIVLSMYHAKGNWLQTNLLFIWYCATPVNQCRNTHASEYALFRRSSQCFCNRPRSTACCCGCNRRHNASSFASGTWGVLWPCEIGHIVNRDILIQTIAGVMASAIVTLANIFNFPQFLVTGTVKMVVAVLEPLSLPFSLPGSRTLFRWPYRVHGNTWLMKPVRACATSLSLLPERAVQTWRDQRQGSSSIPVTPARRKCLL